MSDFACIFCPVPTSLTGSNLLSWTVCLPRLSDQFKSKKDQPKTGYSVKKLKEVH